jgi:seryl-tRNA(Sec) selenium transferase
VFVDIQPDTFNIDPALIRSVISERTRAILCVHQMGMPCDLEGITEVAREFSLPVIEDAACAAGSEIFWRSAWRKSVNLTGTSLVFFSSTQGHDHRRRGHAHHCQS